MADDTQKEQGPRRASIDDFKVKRDSSGEIEPVEVKVIQMDRMIEMKPMTYGQVLTFDKPGEPVGSWPLEDKVRLVKESVTEPDMSHITRDTVLEHFDMWSFDQLCLTIAMYSGPLKSKAYENGEKGGKEEGS